MAARTSQAFFDDLVGVVLSELTHVGAAQLSMDSSEPCLLSRQVYRRQCILQQFGRVELVDVPFTETPPRL